MKKINLDWVITKKFVDLDDEINQKIRKIVKFKDDNKFLNYQARNIIIRNDEVKFTLETEEKATIYASFSFYSLFVWNWVFYIEWRYIDNFKERFSKYLDLVIEDIKNTLNNTQNKTQTQKEEQEEDLPF